MAPAKVPKSPEGSSQGHTCGGPSSNGAEHGGGSRQADVGNEAPNQSVTKRNSPDGYDDPGSSELGKHEQKRGLN